MNQSLVPSGQNLRDLESVIERGRQTFIEVGIALMEIRDGRLYREDGYETFEEYSRERWGWNLRRTEQLMQAAEVVASLASGEAQNFAPPKNDAQVRELVRVDDPDVRRSVWHEARETHGENVTAAKVREIVDRHIPELDSQRERARAEQAQGDRYLAAALTPDSLTVRNAPVMAFLSGFDRVTAFLKSNPPAEIAPALSEGDRIAIRHSIIFTYRKWCDEMEREMGAGIRVIGGNRA